MVLRPIMIRDSGLIREVVRGFKELMTEELTVYVCVVAGVVVMVIIVSEFLASGTTCKAL